MGPSWLDPLGILIEDGQVKKTARRTLAWLASLGILIKDERVKQAARHTLAWLALIFGALGTMCSVLAVVLMVPGLFKIQGTVTDVTTELRGLVEAGLEEAFSAERRVEVTEQLLVKSKEAVETRTEDVVASGIQELHFDPGELRSEVEEMRAQCSRVQGGLMAVQASEPLVDLLQEGMEWVTVAVGQPVEWEMEELLEESLKYTEEATVALITLSEVLVEVEAEVADTSKKSGVLVAERGGGSVEGRDRASD